MNPTPISTDQMRARRRATMPNNMPTYSPTAAATPGPVSTVHPPPPPPPPPMFTPPDVRSTISHPGQASHPFTQWPDAPNPNAPHPSASVFGAAGMGDQLEGIGKIRGNPFGPDDGGRGSLYSAIYNSFRDPAFGGGPNEWGGDQSGGGCPRSGAPVKLYGDPSWWTKDTIPNRYFRRFTTSTGRTGDFSLSDERYTQRGLIKCCNWEIGDLLLTEDGEEMIVKLEDIDDPDGKVDFYHAIQGHIYSAYGVVGHNKDVPWGW